MTDFLVGLVIGLIYGMIMGIWFVLIMNWKRIRIGDKVLERRNHGRK